MKKNSITQGLFFIYFEKFFSQLVSLVVTIVLSRILMPKDYGVVAIITIFLNIADVFVTAGFGNALIQKKHVDDKDYSTILSFSLCISLFLYVIFYLGAPYIAAYYIMPDLNPLFRVLALRLPLASIASIQQAYISRNMLFHKQFLSTLAGSIISAILGIIMAVKGFGAWALVAQYLCGSIISLIVLQCLISLKYKIGFTKERFSSLFSFGWKVLLTVLINRIYNEIRSLVIGKMFTPADLAFYTKGQFFPNLLMSNIDSSLTRVLFPVISRQQDDLLQVRSLVSNTVSISTYLIIPLLTFLGIIADKLVLLVLTEKWLPCVPYLQIFCVYYMFIPINSAKYQAITAIGRSDVSLKCEIIQKFFGVIILLYTIFISRTIFAIVFGNIAFMIVALIITSIVCKKYINLSYLQQVKDIMHSIIIGVLVYAILYIVSDICVNNYIDLLIQSITFIAIFIIASKLFGFVEYVKLEHLFLSVFEKMKTKNKIKI